MEHRILHDGAGTGCDCSCLLLSPTVQNLRDPLQRPFCDTDSDAAGFISILQYYGLFHVSVDYLA